MTPDFYKKARALHLLNFSKRFRAALRRGTKRQTMRPRRKRAIKVGDRLRLYVGLMRPGAELIKEVRCKSVRPVILYETGIGNDQSAGNWRAWQQRTRKDYKRDEIEARADGFENYIEMLFFFRKLYKTEKPIHLEVIKW